MNPPSIPAFNRFCVTCLALSLSYFEGVAQVVTQWTFGTDSTVEQVYGMAFTTGENLLLAVNEDIDSIGQSDIGIRRISRTGQLLDRAIIGSEWDDFVRGLEPAGSNRYLLSGMRTAFEPFRQLATLMMIDSTGQVAWEWVHPDTSSISEFKIARSSPDGSILACGNISSPGQSIKSLVMRFDENGIPIGEFTQQDTVNEISHAAWPLPSGHWVVTGDRQMPDLTYRPYLMRIDEQDSLVWRQFYDKQVNGGSQNLIGLSDGNLMVIGESYPAPGIFAFDIFLRKVTEDGTSLWYNTYGADGADAGFSIVESPTDRSLSFTGYYLNPLTNNTDAAIFQVDSAGQELNRTWAGLGEIDYGNVIRLDSKDSLWISGFSNQGLDAQGLLATHRWNPSPNSLPDPRRSQLAIYPCPARSEELITLRSSSPFSAVTIRNNLGQIVFIKHFPLSGEVRITAPIQAGIYLVELLIDHTPQTLRLVISP